MVEPIWLSSAFDARLPVAYATPEDSVGTDVTERAALASLSLEESRTCLVRASFEACSRSLYG